MDLSISNVIEISVSEAQTGVGEYNTSNLAIFTHEVPGETFGDLGYAIYLSPAQVATDFGTNSETYAMALAIFSQQPNILANDGYLVVIPFVEQVQGFAFSGIAASGTFMFNYGGHASAAVNWNDTAAQIQSKLQAIPGLAEVTVTGSIASQSLQVAMGGVYGATPALMTITNDSLETSGSVAVNVTPSQVSAGETLATAITRTEGLVQYFGLMGTLIFSQADMLAAAAVVQSLNKMAFFVSETQADVAPGGMLDLLRSGSFTQNRGLYYGGSTDPLVMMASYVGGGLSTNFNGSNTTQTRHLKGMNGVQPDSSMTQTLLNQCLAAGVDTYISLQGVAKVFCSGTNKYFDQVYNLCWFVGALEVAGFDYLAESDTKIPQTEPGMDGLKGSYRAICEQAVTNQYLAPGTWNSPDTFGVQADLIANISQRGYYIYSQPIAQQSQTARAARQAPLVQIAIKEAGAIQSSTVIVNVNA